jgi:hypothetical protein
MNISAHSLPNVTPTLRNSLSSMTMQINKSSLSNESHRQSELMNYINNIKIPTRCWDK